MKHSDTLNFRTHVVSSSKFGGLKFSQKVLLKFNHMFDHNYTVIIYLGFFFVLFLQISIISDFDALNWGGDQARRFYTFPKEAPVQQNLKPLKANRQLVDHENHQLPPLDIDLVPQIYLTKQSGYSNH